MAEKFDLAECYDETLNQMAVSLEIMLQHIGETQQAAMARLIDDIDVSERIFVIGCGRAGLAARAFAMRLTHLGYKAHWLLDDTTPALTSDDLLLAVSISGEVAHINAMLQKARNVGVCVFSVTTDRNCPMNEFADDTLVVPGQIPPTLNMADKHYQLPMFSIVEEELFLLFDLIVVAIMHQYRISETDMRQRHRNVE